MCQFFSIQQSYTKGEIKKKPKTNKQNNNQTNKLKRTMLVKSKMLTGEV